VADIALVMAKTDPDAPRHKQFSTFLVELPNPGYKIKRDIPTMAMEGPLSHILGGGHAEVEIKNLEIPAENLLGGEGNGFNGAAPAGVRSPAAWHAQRCDGAARARHGYRARDDRQTFGKKLDERQPCSSCSPNARASCISRG
jgi:acyl-CoA dehydrogenase